jgi:glucan 1,3-beta-glucosidase
VLVSLHGAQGSQNGHDHSGRVGRARWYDSKECRDDTVKTLNAIAQRYKNNPALWGIELLNEPQWRIFQRELKQFYHDAFTLLTKRLPPHVRIVYSDAFMPRRFGGIIGNGTRERATLDIHWYHNLFWAYRWVPIAWYYQLVRSHGKLLRRLTKYYGVIVGEWNGIIAKERLDRYPVEQHQAVVKEHIARQLAAYQYADAWFYWNYKTEQRGIWHFRSLVEDGILEVPSSANS